MLASGSKDCTTNLWELYNEDKIRGWKNKTSAVCLLLLQSILHAYNHENCKINLHYFSELYKAFESLQPNEKELVEYLLSDIAMEKKRKRRKIEQNK